ncbi:MAG TPA: thioredoxin domain-containing protein, partial [Devosia sp.]|nr:thioredoxin domain-containing protein [Devosia sp.]
MSRLNVVLLLLVGVLAGGLGVTLLNRGPAPVSDDHVRSVVSEMLAADTEAQQPPTLDTAQVNALIEDFLMNDPAILERMSAKLGEGRRVAQRAAQAEVIAANHTEIYEGAGNVVLGNPEGDVTLVEMFDYNCSYCRNALPDLATLIAEDPNLKVILKEFPILSEGSIEAAKVAVLVNENE